MDGFPLTKTIQAKRTTFIRRSRLSLQEKLIYLGIGWVTVSALVLTVVLLSSNEDAVATKKDDMSAVGAGASVETILLLAPKAGIAEGTQLTPDHLEQLSWPRNEVPEGAIRRPEDIQGMFSTAALAEHQPILRTQLSSSPPAEGLAKFIPQGYRAATIRVDETSGVEFWTQPGTHVDIVVTFVDREDGREKSQIAIENAVVISYNGEVKGATTGARPDQSGIFQRTQNTATVTLAVPVLDAVKLQTISQMGKISLLLRNPGEIKSTGNLTISREEITNNKQKEKSPAIKKSNGFVRFTDGQGVNREIEVRGQEWIEGGPDKE